MYSERICSYNQPLTQTLGYQNDSLHQMIISRRASISFRVYHIRDYI